MSYIGPEPNPGQNREVDDISSTFNGSTTAFTLQVNSQNVSPGSSNNIIVSLGGVVQNPGTDYNIAASTITFTTAPASGLSFFGLVLGQQVDIQSLADGTSPTMSSPTITGDLTVDTSTLKVDASNNRVGIGIASPESVLHVSNAVAAGSDNFSLRIQNPTNASDARVGMFFHVNAVTGSGSDGAYIESANSGSNNGDIRFGSITNLTKTERMRIDSAGSVLVGFTTSATSAFQLQVGDTTDAHLGIINTTAATSQPAIMSFCPANSVTGSQIVCTSEDTFASSSNRTARLGFFTRQSGTLAERLRINSSGVVQIVSERMAMGTSVTNGGTSDGNFCIEFTGNSRNAMKTRDTDNTGTVNHFVLVSGSAACGTITTTTGQAFFNNLSDYRSKQNDVKITDGIEKIKLLRPIRFNYKVDKDTLCDGFFAHEVSAAVPTAVQGEKDAMAKIFYEEGDTIPDGKKIGDIKEYSTTEIDPQMLDTGKIIPLLTAALQESITKIETLETKVAALEAA